MIKKESGKVVFKYFMFYWVFIH